MDQSSFRHWVGEMWNQAHVVRLAEGEDLHVLGDASYIGQSDAGVVDELLFD